MSHHWSLLVTLIKPYRFRQNPVSGWILMMRSLNECASWMRDLAEIQFRDLMNQDPPTQWVLFLSCNVFLNLFLVKLLFFFWNTMDYFFIVKVVVASLQQVKCFISLPHDITVNTHCHVTMWMWCFLGNYVMSQWVGDVAIDTKQSCDKQPGSFTQDPGGMKTWIFQLKNWI